MIDVGAIPQALAERAQWLVWRFEPGEKKPKKMPYYACGRRRTGVQGSELDRSDLVSLEVAVAKAAGGYSGIGFAFLPGDGLIGIDIDGCIDAATGVITPRAGAIIDACASYTELSPSGTGVHIIVSGESETFKSNDIGLEVFCGRQYFTFTANAYPNTPSVIAPITPIVLNKLRATVRQAKGVHAAKAATLPAPVTDERSKLESALACVSADCGYDEWYKVGMAIFATLGAGGISVWDWWSSKSKKYAGIKDLEGHWKSFNPDGGITSATIYKMAVDAGWRPPKQQRPAILPREKSAMLPGDDSTAFDSPAPLGLAAVPDVMGFVALEWALAHCALVQGSTDVWDSLNKLKMKRPAFLAMVGKESAKFWETHKERRTISPRNLPKTVRGVAATTGGAGDDGIVMMLDRYTLLYGTKTVWDAEKRMVLAYDAMALARSGDLATRWIGHPLHREIDAGNLVFDPTQKLSLDTHVNMFQGLPLKPARDDAKSALVLELLHSLCSGESNGDDVLHWVVQWLAYPLQNPGAKMQTGLLFFGERQGTGKSLFFEGIMRPIYGDHGVTVGQHQLDSTFTGWKSQKLYILFEEILSRADKYSHFGLVKHMITGGDTPINEKNLPTRFEANHANTVMLSNEFQAVPIEPDDRRFMVVEARNPLSPDVLAGLTDGDRVADGVSAAFYDFLMRYPLDGFKAHAKPLMTASKQRMIRFGLPSWDAFYQAWSASELNAPFCTCLATDLYLVYDRWCSRGNERAITQTKFSELMATRVHRSRQKIYLGGADKQLLTVFKVPSDVEETLSKACQTFRDGADIKDRV